MKTFILAALLLVTFGFTTDKGGPKITKKDHLVLVDGVPYFLFERTTLVFGVSIAKPNGEKLFFLRQEEYYDNARISNSNPNGKQTYYSLIREGSDEVSCEFNGVSAKYLAKILLEYKVLDADGNIIEENFNKMTVHVGMQQSKNRPVNVNYR